MRAHWALHELGLDYDAKLVASRSGETQTDEFGRLNPKRKIPVLRDGDFTLTESAAIVTYLGDTYGGASGLVPAAGTRERARYDEACFFVMMELDAHTLYVVRRHRDLAALYGEAPAAVTEAFAGFDRQVATVESALRDGRPLPARRHLHRRRHPARDLPAVGGVLRSRAGGWAVGVSRAGCCARPACARAAAINYSILPDGSPRK